MTELESRALAAVDEHALVASTCDLVTFQTTNGDECPAQEYVAGVMAELGMEADVWDIDVDELSKDPAFSTEMQRKHALGVVGGIGAGRGRTLVLNGHVDVVPAGEPERWTVPPWQGTLRNGRLYGRGTADMKGGLCCALAAVRALQDAGIRIPGRVVIHSVVGEEDGGMGTLATIRRGHTGNGGIVLEPTNLVIAPAQAGAFNFRITVPGLAAHGALRTEGVDPIEKFIGLYRAIQKLERRRNGRPRHPLFADQALPYPICIGTVRAGVWASTVPESLICEGRLGIAVDEDPQEARQELENAVAVAAATDDWLREHPPVLEWWGGQFVPAVIPAEHPAVTTLAGACQAATGTLPPVRGMPFGADMGLLINHGNTPTVLFGPGDVRQAHAPDEFVSVDQLLAATRTLVLAILRFCGD